MKQHLTLYTLQNTWSTFFTQHLGVCEHQDVSHHAVVKREHADISAMMDVVASDDGVAVVFHPDPC